MNLTFRLKEGIITVAAIASLVSAPVTANAFKMHADSDIEKQDSCDDNDRERYTLQQVFDMAGAPTKGQIDDITGKGDGYIITLKNNPNTVKVFNGSTWTEQAFAPGQNEGISVLEKKCKNAKELSKGDIFVLNAGTATAYGLEGTELVPTGAVIYGLPQNATSIATIASEGNCKLGVYEPGLAFMRIFKLSGLNATEVGQRNVPVFSDAINGIEAYPGNKLLIATDNAVQLYSLKRGNWILKDAAVLKEGTPTLLPNGAQCIIGSQCQSGGCNIPTLDIVGSCGDASPLILTGRSCVDSLQCQSNLCAIAIGATIGVCSDANSLPNGASCAVNAQCISNYCNVPLGGTEGTCQ